MLSLLIREEYSKLSGDNWEPKWQPLLVSQLLVPQACGAYCHVRKSPLLFKSFNYRRFEFINKVITFHVALAATRMA